MESPERAAVRRGLDAIKPYLAAFVSQRVTGSAALPTDIAGLLKLVLAEWDRSFKRDLPPVVRSYVHELRDIRNRWAHEEAFDSSEASRALDTMRQLAKAIGGPSDLTALKLIPAEQLSTRIADGPVRRGKTAANGASQMAVAPSDFWDESRFDLADPLNQEIWTQSPDLQEQIQTLESLSLPGVIGAQQAMVHPKYARKRSLPWVPDLVGTRWKVAEGAVIVGSAYAGFIKEYSTRSAAMPLDQYLAAASVGDFQRLFLRYVVRQDPSYYTPIRNLCSMLDDASQISMVDLCRVSLVKRGSGDDLRTDSSLGIVRDGAAIFEKYVEATKASEWLWRRFVTSQARCVVALGTTAEHGLLRLFSRHGMRISHAGKPFSIAPIINGAWANEYADPSKTLNYWIKNQTWWTVTGIIETVPRIWHILPVYHPARHATYDPNYQRTKEVLALSRSAL